MITFGLADFVSSFDYTVYFPCLQAKHYMNWCFDLSIKIVRYTKSCSQYFAQRLDIEKQQNAEVTTLIGKGYSEIQIPHFFKTYPLYTYYHQLNKKVVIALSSCKNLHIMWLLFEEMCNDICQKQRKLQVIHSIFLQQQKITARKLSFYFGNVYHSVPKLQLQQRHPGTTEHIQKQKFLKTNKFYLLLKGSGTYIIFYINIYKLRVDIKNSSITYKSTIASKSLLTKYLKMCTLHRKHHRHRWRRRKSQQLGIDKNNKHTNLLHPCFTSVFWHKRYTKQYQQPQKKIGIQLTEEKEQKEENINQSSEPSVKQLGLAYQNCCHCVCCICCFNCKVNNRQRNFNISSFNNNTKTINENSCSCSIVCGDCTSTNKKDDISGSSNSNNSNEVNSQHIISNSYYCCSSSCCYFHNSCYCCCCCCNNHCPFYYCSLLCICWHRYQQHEMEEKQQNNNGLSNNRNTNSNYTTAQSSENSQNQNEIQLQHQNEQQQRDQYHQMIYNRYHYECQEYQNNFNQPLKFHHRRRRRHLCINYTSLNSCCCYFFKWICWRHHNIKNKYTCFLTNIRNNFKRQEIFYSTLFTKHYRSALKRFSARMNKSLFKRIKMPQIMVPNCNEYNLVKVCYNQKLSRIRYFQNITSLRIRHTKQQFYKNRQEYSSKHVLQSSTVIPLDKIEGSSEMNCTNTALKSVMATAAEHGSTARKFKRLFRRHWVWLMMGLAWLEGPKLSECSKIMKLDSGSVTTDYVAAYSYNNCSNESSISNSCTQAMMPQSLSKSTEVQLTFRTSRSRTHPGFALIETEKAKSPEQEIQKQNDSVRLESIKLQILSKLGLKCKPNVTHPLPKQFIWDTIYRADGISSVSDFDFNDVHRAHHVRMRKYAISAQHSSNRRVVRAHRTINRDSSTDNIEPGDAVVYENNDDMVRDFFEIQGNAELDIEEKGLFFQNSQKYRNKLQYKLHPLQQKHKQNKFYYENDKTSNAVRKSSESQVSHQSSKHWKSLGRKYNAVSQPVANDILEPDDYYGNTQEIIAFAEKGEMYKNHRLVEFSSPKHTFLEQKLYIRHAEIHIKIEKVRNMSAIIHENHEIRNIKLKLWIFQLISGDHSQGGFDQVARFCTSINVEKNALGWQKINITKTVQYWNDRSATNDKLRLLIDCTGCGQYFVLHLFDIVNMTPPQKAEMINVQEEQIFQRRYPVQRNLLRFFSTVTGTRSKKNKKDISAKVLHMFSKQYKANKYWKSNDKKYNSLTTYLGNLQVKKKHRGQRKELSHNSLQQKKQVSYNKESKEKNEHIEDYLNPYRPFLVMHTEPKRARRMRRRVIDCLGAHQGQCCKESFYVSFKALGWDDWIIAPRGYFANYCRGDCSGPFHTPDTFKTFHAHFIEEYRKLGLLNGMQPCCAPVKFSSMSLIYYGDEGIIKRDLPKMVVDECGCP